MKRWTFCILLCLLLGVVTTVGVAWGLAVTVDVSASNTPGEWRQIRDGHNFWQGQRKHATGAMWFAARHVRSRIDHSSDKGEYHGDNPVPSWSGFAQAPSEYLLGRREGFWRWGDARGWPRLALWTEYKRQYYDIVDAKRVQLMLAGIETTLPPWDSGNPHTDHARILPLRPIPIGFLIDTLFTQSSGSRSSSAGGPTCA